MAYNEKLASRVREYLNDVSGITVDEKKMFRGLAFMVNDKMCINVVEDMLMCRFPPEQTEDLSERAGFLPMIMKGKTLSGYCYVEPTGYKSKKDFEFWLTLCLAFNKQAKSSKKIKK